MIGRHPLNATQSPIIEKPFDVPKTLEIVAMSAVEDNTPATMCWLAKNKQNCRPGSGAPLEPGTKVEIDMLPGEQLWGVTESVGLLFVSVKGYRGVN